MYSIRSFLYRRNKSSRYCLRTATPTYSTTKSPATQFSCTANPRPLLPASKTHNFFHSLRWMRLFPHKGPAGQLLPHSSWQAKSAQVVSTQHVVCSDRSGSQKHGSGRKALGRGAFSKLDSTCFAAPFFTPSPPPTVDWCIADGPSSAHSTSVICSTSFGREIGRFVSE